MAPEAGEPAALLSWEQVAAWRLRRHHLDERAPRDALLDVTAAICGLHAQLLSSAELTLWARVADLQPDAVGSALWTERSLFKTWAMRGTLHLLPATEFGLWTAAAGTRTHYLKASWLRYFGVTRDELERLLDAVAEALDGEMLTRAELAEAVARRIGSAELGDKLRESWGALLKPAAFRGLLCFAPGVGQQVRFTRPDRWLPAVEEVDPGRALRDVTRRFLAANGPATRDDYARWWGMTPAAAGSLIRGLGDEVVAVDVDGAPMWMTAGHATEAARAQPVAGVRLLPAFDQYVVAATRHADHLLPGDFSRRIYRPQGWLSPVVLVDGRMEGIWRHERKGGRLDVTVEPFRRLPANVRRAVDDEASRLPAFLGGALALRWAD